jgi:hypothetical protein
MIFDDMFYRIVVCGLFRGDFGSIDKNHHRQLYPLNDGPEYIGQVLVAFKKILNDEPRLSNDDSFMEILKTLRNFEDIIELFKRDYDTLLINSLLCVILKLDEFHLSIQDCSHLRRALYSTFKSVESMKSGENTPRLMFIILCKSVDGYFRVPDQIKEAFQNAEEKSTVNDLLIYENKEKIKHIKEELQLCEL